MTDAVGKDLDEGELDEDEAYEIEEEDLGAEFPVFDMPAATHWPSLGGDDVEGEWAELRKWVEQLRERFTVLDHHVIPACWWRHNGHVEALAALRDHELVCYSETSPASAPMEWMRSLRDIIYLLSNWTAELACSARHEDPSPALRAPDYEGWEEHCRRDRERRSGSSGGEDVEGQ